ncbi:MAG: alanine--tRNA ligase, partial [Candidatus Saccharimonadales bacterium]
MTAQEIRAKYLKFFEEREHTLVPRAPLVLKDDPTTLFTGSGMQPLIPYLLGQPHPQGKRLANSQTCLRAEDMDEVGDNRHTTFFEMLGNWSLGDYFKKEQLPWFFLFLTRSLGLDPNKLYVSCFIGDPAYDIPKDTESAEIWKKLFSNVGIDAKEVDLGSEADGYEKGMQNGRIFYYDATKNWWSRTGPPANMPEGEPGGPDSEIFYDFGGKHDLAYGDNCHPNCDCGRFGEIGNSVFMAYRKVGDKFEPLPNTNVDFGGGLERIAAAVNSNRDMFKTSVIWPIIQSLEEMTDKKYAEHPASMRVIADHMRAATWLGVDGVEPSNKEQGYVLRRLLRRAIRFAFDLDIERDLCARVVPIVTGLYAADFPEVEKHRDRIVELFAREEKIFRQTLRAGVKQLENIAKKEFSLTGIDLFRLYDTYGFPVELSVEEASLKGIKIQEDWHKVFDQRMEEQRERSQTASAGTFKGGLADTSEEVVRYHTATHLMYQALKEVLGPDVVQRGSNITAERTRFDFSHPEKVTPEQQKQIEDIVNKKIEEDLPVRVSQEQTKEALSRGASGAFGDKYGDAVKVYTIGNADNPFSREICVGPHVEHTGQIGEGGNDSTGSPRKRKFKIVKEEASSAGV